VPAPPSQDEQDNRVRDGRQQRPFKPRSPFQPGRLGIQPPRRLGPPRLLDAPLAASASLRQAVQDTGMPPREALMVRTLVSHGWLIDEYCEEVARLELTSAVGRSVRDALLAQHASGEALDTAAMHRHLRDLGLDAALEQLGRSGQHRGDRFAEPDADPIAVRAGWQHLLHLHLRDGWERQLREAYAEWREAPTEEGFAQILELKKLLATGVELDEAAS
jgi:DNA primase